MLRSMFRVLFALAVTLSLTFGVFSGVGTSQVFAANQPPTAAAGYNPVASVPTGVNYCYPSGYNKQGWRCCWRLAMYPYPMSTYNCGYYGSPCGGYYGNYCGNYYGSYCGGYSGTGGRNGIVDYRGQPRYNPCYYYSTCYNPCYNYGSYCNGGYR
jgi:hypothetical protein